MLLFRGLNGDQLHLVYCHMSQEQRVGRQDAHTVYGWATTQNSGKTGSWHWSLQGNESPRWADPCPLLEHS